MRPNNKRGSAPGNTIARSEPHPAPQDLVVLARHHRFAGRVRALCAHLDSGHPPGFQTRNQSTSTRGSTGTTVRRITDTKRNHSYMETLLGFKLDFWDYATFAVLALLVLSGLISVVWLAGLPGRIAIARKHPDAEAVKMMGYAGFLPRCRGFRRSSGPSSPPTSWTSGASRRRRRRALTRKSPGSRQARAHEAKPPSREAGRNQTPGG